VKVAVVHDWLGPMTGAERVLEQILACYPGADVFSTIDFLPPEHRAALHGARVTTSFIQHLPKARTGYWNYIPLMPFAVERFDLRGYDLVISNSHTIAKGARTSRDQAHVCYLMTPMRFAWDLEAHYLEAFGVRGPRRAAARAVLAALRRWDARTASRIDRFVSASRFVAERCTRYYHRDSDVVYPPLDTEYFTPSDASPDAFYLAASRLTPFKRLDLIVEAFRELPDRRLIVIGDGPDRERVRSQSGPNVTLLGYQPDDVLRDHMRRARAFLFAAPEDFGLVMAEAQACGTPVIALGHGGATEIVRDVEGVDATGVLFGEQTPGSLANAVLRFEHASHRITRDSCRRNALRFSASRFREEFRALVSRTVDERIQRRQQAMP